MGGASPAHRDRDWDARLYHHISEPQAEWGSAVLARLPLRGDERVIDGGCGSGRVTARLVERLPGGHVVAVDHSPAMLAEARRTLAGPAAEGRVTFVETDLLALDQRLAEPADAVFSNATFHWINDHERLFQVLHACLRPGGRLVAQWGGRGNLETFIRHGDRVAAREPYAPYLAGLREWHHRASVQDTERRLRAAGFLDVRTWLEPSPQPFADRATFQTFVQQVVLGRHVALLPPHLHDRFATEIVDAVEAGESGRFVLDYVRLNIDARRAGGRPAGSAGGAAEPPRS